MKKTLLIITLFGGVLVTNSFTNSQKSMEQDTSLANARKYRGIYVFMESEPTNKYETLGDVQKLGSWSGGYEERRDGLINKAKKEYPNCDAIIIFSKTVGAGLGATAIKFN